MTDRRHKNDTRTFEELTFQEQANSLNAQFSTLPRAIRCHVDRAATSESKTPEETRAKCLAQLDRLRQRIQE